MAATLLPLPRALLGATLLGAVFAVGVGGALVAGTNLRIARADTPVLPLESWDPASGEWSPAGALPDPSVAPSLVPLTEDRVVVTGGAWGAMPVAHGYLWSASSSSLTDIGAPETSHRCQSAIRLTGNRVLVVSSTDEDDWGEGAMHGALFDGASGAWSKLPMDPDRAVRAVVSLDDARVLFILASSVAVWRADTRAWPSPLPAKGEPLDCSAAAFARLLPDGRVLVVSRDFQPSQRSPSRPDWAWIADPTSSTLTPATKLQDALVARDPTSAGDDVEIEALVSAPGGGVALVRSGEIDLVPPSLDSIAAIALPGGRGGRAVALLPDGRVLLAGGEEDGAFVGEAETVNLATKQVTPTRSLHAPRWGASAVTLESGHVLVVGGSIEQLAIPWKETSTVAIGVLAALASLGGIAWLARRSKRPLPVVAVALLAGVVLVAVGFASLALVLGGAIKG